MLMRPFMIGRWGVLESELATAVVASCLAFAAILNGRQAWAENLDLTAYNIWAAPKPGPVETFRAWPGSALAPIPFQLPFDWSADPYGDQNWRFNLHTLRVVDPALAAGDFDYAREVFLDWQRWHENCWLARILCFERATDQSWDDMATGIRASRLAYLLHSTGWHDEQLIELAEQHATKLHDSEFIASNNHALFQLHGLAALCVNGRLPSCRGVEQFIERQLDPVLRDQFAESGMHRENSPAYHFLATDLLARVAPLFKGSASEIVATIESAEANKKWLVHPDRTTVLLGDSTAEQRPDLVWPRGRTSCRGIRSYEPAPDCYLIEHFPDVGYVVVRSDCAIPPADASMLFVQGGFFNRTHRDADDFSFEWFEHGRKILSDSGKYAYTKDAWEDYFNSTRAHNTVEVNGSDYTRRQDLAYGDAVQRLERASDDVRIIMEVYHEMRNTWHRREIAYRPGRQLMVEDTLRSDKKRRYVQWHHFDRAFKLSGDSGRFHASDGNMTIDVTTFSSCTEGTTYEKIKGQTEPFIQGWTSVTDRERHPRWALGVACEGETATFTALFRLSDGQGPS